MYNADGSVNPSGGSQDMVFYFTGNSDATITVEIPSLGWSRSYAYAKNSMFTSDVMPKSGSTDARIISEGLSHNGIHIILLKWPEINPVCRAFKILF